MPKHEVTEFDLRAPEFQRHDIKPEDYEFRDDGKVVRKDRWEVAVRNVVSIIGWSRREFELSEVVEEVRCRLDCGMDGDEEYDSWAIVPSGVALPSAPQREAPPGKWKVDMPDGLCGELPGDPPGPRDVRRVIGGYVYFVTPRTGKLVALNPPSGVAGTSNDQGERT